VRFTTTKHLHLFGWVALCALLLLAVNVVAQDGEAGERPEIAETDRCVACHFDDDSMPEGWVVADIHLQAGLSCAGCHGGDPTSDDEDIAMGTGRSFGSTNRLFSLSSIIDAGTFLPIQESPTSVPPLAKSVGPLVTPHLAS